MPILRKIGPITVEVAPGRAESGDVPGVSATYRNVAAADELPTTLNGCATLYELFNKAVEEHGDNKCLGWRPVAADGTPGDYEFINYKETQTRATHLASALVGAGLAPRGGKLGLLAPNRVEWMVAIRAADRISATIVPMYDTLGADAVEYIVHHSGLTVALVDATKLKAFVEVAPRVADQVKTVVVMGEGDEAALGALRDAGIAVRAWDEFLAAGEAKPVKPSPPKPDDVACIMYTSGTTGTPKGVQLTQRAMVSGVCGALTMIQQAKMGFSPEDSMLSYMPLAHIFDRLLEEFTLAIGASVGYWQGDVKKLMDDVIAFKPTLFIAVPRILERVTDSVSGQLAKGSGAVRAAFNAAYAYKLFLLRRGLSHFVSGLGVDQLIFAKIRHALGGRVRFIVSGGAPLAPHVEDFCNVCLAPVLQGYGLTETCAASFIMLPDPRLAHTVGPPLAPTEFRLESVKELKYDATAEPPKGEIHIRGPMVFAGYYKDAKKTAEEMDPDGWFRTGDIGTITPQGCLKIIDRKKNIFKLAQGEYIAVEYLESKYGRSDAVEQVWVYGNSLESALVAVVVPHASWLKKQGDAGCEEAKKAMLAELARTGKEEKLKGFEMIKGVHLEPNQFSVDEDLMTPSLKLKRPQLQKKYQKEIDAMYAKLKAKK